MVQEQLLLGTESVVQFPVPTLGRLILVRAYHLVENAAELVCDCLHGFLEASAYLLAYLRQFLELVDALERLEQVPRALRLRSDHYRLDERAGFLVQLGHLCRNFWHTLYAGVRLQWSLLERFRI